MSDPLSILGNVASLVSLVLTIVVLTKVANITTSFTLQGRAPEILRSLRAARKNLGEGLGNNLPDVAGAALAKAKAGLDSLAAKTEGQVLQAVVHKARDCAAGLLAKKPADRSSDELQAFSEKLSGVIAGLEHATKDLKWKARDE